MSRRFDSFKRALNKYIDLVSQKLRPINRSDAISKSYSSLFRLPTFALEQTFVKIFNMQEEDLLIVKDVKTAALEQKQKSTDSFKERKLEDNFMNYPRLVTECVRVVSSQLGLTGLVFEPFTVEQSINSLPTNTSSGFPDFVRPKANNISNVSMQAYHILSTGDMSWLNYITTCAWRTQVRPSGLKFRIIWVVSQLIHVLEYIFAGPFFEHFTNNKFTSYCYANVFNDLVPRIERSRKYKFTISIDFKGFDQSCCSEVIVLFFQSIKSHLNIKNKRLNDIFDGIVAYNAFGLVATTNKGEPVIIRKEGSVFSGSVFTNFMDSWINLFVCNFCLMKMGFKPGTYILNVLGDDNLMNLNESLDLNEFSRLLQVHFGMTVLVEECDVYESDFETVLFLGAEINENERRYDFDLIKRQLCISTNWINDEDMSESERLHSKLASICFKFTEGYKLYDQYAPILRDHLGLQVLPDYYYEIYYSNAGPYDNMKLRRVGEFKYSGWRLQ